MSLFEGEGLMRQKQRNVFENVREKPNMWNLSPLQIGPGEQDLAVMECDDRCEL